jgi:hypothetical protein
MEITRNVILDLLPLHLADEASADTRALSRNTWKLIQNSLTSQTNQQRSCREIFLFR